ncbi:hypothetical protein J3R83DRAFT_9621 [Lanmaoa asiatica]|nr:hypothetical protein J3R83DRAFT_9621 [Lanmaoa asiatica]
MVGGTECWANPRRVLRSVQGADDEDGGVVDGSAKEKVEQTRNILGLQEIEIVLRQYKVFLSQSAFLSLEDRIRALDVEEQKRNRLRDAEAEAGINLRSTGDPYAPYASPGLPPDDYADPFNQVSSQAHVTLVANASPFQRGDLYDDEYEDRKSFQTNSNYGSESYTPSRNMFQNADEGLMAKDTLTGKIMENETTKVIKETSASTLGLVVLAPNVMDTVYSPQVVRSNEAGLRRKVCQAWEKLAINMII